MYLIKLIVFIVISSSFTHKLIASEEMRLIDNLRKAKAGDYIVTAQNKSYSLLHIASKQSDRIAVEEISIAAPKYPKGLPWHKWVADGAQNYSSWVVYHIDLQSGQSLATYALTRQGWMPIAHRNNILYTLLNLQLSKIPHEQRRRVGAGFTFTPRDKRPLWQPVATHEGASINGLHFEGWKTRWPKDGSDLSDMVIEAYIPAEETAIPNYFPYWLQISGSIVCAKIRIVDTGSSLSCPIALPVR